jgi:SpoVK/Ycf46/Vps4 family AAA+-type ATPase
MADYYQHNQEYLRDELQRIDLMLQHRIAEMQFLWRKKSESKWPGLYISDEEVNQILEGGAEHAPGTPSGGAPQEPDRLNPPGLQALSEKIIEKQKQSLRQGLRLPAWQLADMFRLSAFEMQALFLCLAPEVDLKYQKLYAYLQDDITKKAPIVELVLDLLCRSFEEKVWSRRFFLPQAPLLKYELLTYADSASAGDPPLPARVLKLNDRIAEFLLGFNEIDNRLTAFARLVLPQKGLADLVLDEKERTFFKTLVSHYKTAAQASSANGLQRAVYYFYGPYGSGKKATAEAVCKELGVPLLWVSLRKIILQDPLPFEKAMGLIFRESLLMPCAVYLEDFDLLLKDEDPWPIRRDQLLKTVEELSWLTFLSGRKNWAPRRLNHPFLTVSFPVPDYELRKALWQAGLDGQRGLPGLDLSDLADKFKFTAGQIQDAGATAQNEALQKRLQGSGLSSADVYAACRVQSNQKLSALAVKLKPLYTWKDIVLPLDQMTLLNEIIDQVKHHQTVFYQWGFDRKVSLGKGLNIIFSGPSGTGKTMAAEIIANALSLDLYKIDLSLVVSKYIGETEKNLGRIFEEAATSNCILFFDEADALFGKRSEVRDSHDRYANIEIGYLLQKMEEHSGMVILATNLRKNMDEAFMRRMNFCVDFPFPDEGLREMIWRKIFPEESPLSKDLDYKFLSERLKLAGGNIKNIAVTAAFYAAGGKTEINLQHIMLASKREYQKIGKMFVKEDFEPYGELTG